MIIPVRVPAELAVHCVGGVKTLVPEHPLYDAVCPACDEQLADRPITLVVVGIPPDRRKPAGFTTGSAVAVHAACAGAS